MHETVFEDGLTDGRHTIGNTVDGHELGLHVGRKRGVRRRPQADGLEAPGRLQANGIALDGDLATGIHQFVDHGIQVGSRSLQEPDVAAGDGGGTQIGTGLDTVGHDGVRRPVQFVHALNTNDVGAGARYARAHRNQAIGQIDHLRLTGGVLDDRLPFGQTGCHHQVLGAGHGDHVSTDARPLQAAGLGMHIPLLDLDLGPHRLQPLDVLIDRPGANGATAGQRHPRFATARNQRAEHQDRGAHGLDHLVGGDRIVQATAIQDQAIDPFHRHADPHIAQEAQHGRDVVEVRHIGEMYRLGSQQGGAQDGQGGVLGAGHGDFAGEGLASINQQLIHAGCSILPGSGS